MPPKLTPEQERDCEDIRKACRLRLKFLCTKILGYADWGKVHDDLEVFLDRPAKRKLAIIPRNHLKSSIITKGWGIQQVLRNPNNRILIANAVWEQSRKFLGSIEKYLTYGSVLPQYFGRFESDNWNQFDCTVRQRNVVLDAPTFVTTGVDKEQTSQHYDIIIGDDLVGPQNVQTPEQRNKVFDYYLSLFDLLEPNGTLMILGTRYHQDDLYARILEEVEQQKNWDVFFRTAYNDDGSVLFPQKFSEAQLLEIRNKPRGALHWSSQYMNNPIDPESADFKQEWIKYYDGTTPNPASLYMTVDPAISLSKDADYTAMLVGGQFQDRRIRIVDYVHKRMIPSDLVDEVFRMVEKWNLHRIGLETFAFQKTLKYDIQNEQRRRNRFFSIDELGKRGATNENILSKEARIRRLQPLFEQGLFEIRADMQDFRDELLAFPRGKHDDLIDCAAWMLDYLVPSQNRIQQHKTIHGSMGWWVDNHLKEPQLSTYQQFMKDLQ